MSWQDPHTRTPAIFVEELDWLKDLYISHRYPLVTVIQWIKGSKENAYNNQLNWVTKTNTLSEAECIWPLKSAMNLVWQKLNLGMVSESMHKAAGLICKEEQVEWEMHCLEMGREVTPNYEGPFAHSIWSWFGRLVTSQKCPLNFGNKENRHNHSLLGILG